MNPDNNNPIANPPQDEAPATPSEAFAGQENAMPETTTPTDAGMMTDEPSATVPEPSADQLATPEPVFGNEQPEAASPELETPPEPLAPAPAATPPAKKDNKTRTIVLAVIAGLILIAGIAVFIISQL